MTATLSRPLPGSRMHNFYPSNRDTSVGSLDSAFQLQEYLAYLIQTDPHDIRRIVSLPKSLSTLDDNRGRDRYLGQDDEKDETVDESCWIYEHLRRLAQDLNHPLITTLQQECNGETCPEMKAGEWLFLCVAHGNGPSVEKCCAIDYILHTLDSATALLNSPKAFPSRITIPPNSHRHFSSLARRLGRIFGHAYYQHREAFEQSEADTSLYSRFLALAAMYDLVPPDFLDIPHRETQGFTGESDDIEISRAPPEEFGVRGNDSPMGRSRTDTMIRAEGFTLPAEEFEEHIPQSDPMESVELPASFYHERDASPPLDEPAAEVAPQLTEESAESDIAQKVYFEDGDPTQELYQLDDTPAHEPESESPQQGESHRPTEDTKAESEEEGTKAVHEDQHEAEEEKAEDGHSDLEVDEFQETSTEPPVESDQVSVSMPAPAVSSADHPEALKELDAEQEGLPPNKEVGHESEISPEVEESKAPSAEQTEETEGQK